MTKIPRGQLAYFRIYPERRSRLHYRVRVFASVAAIRRYLKASRVPQRRLGRRGLAMCSTYTMQRRRAGRWRTLPVMGEIVFPRRGLRAGVIAHECTHAALGWAARIGFTPIDTPATRRRHLWVSADEERFCYGVGEMNRQIAVQIWKRGFQS
jgi:hypothetical protein